MAKGTSSSNKSVYEIAKDLQEKANREARGRLHNDIDKLKGHPEQGTYSHNNGNNDDELKGDICKLDKNKHTNDWRPKGSGPDKYDGPCTGKGGDQKDRFNIGKEWEPQNPGQIDDKHKEVLFPPRRLDMCTSNLENLAEKNRSPKFLNTAGVKVNDSFLGDVLLSAKYEGDFIVDKLRNKGDDPRICRAMKASFADLGDIIRGRDIWTKNSDMQQLEQHLQKIFGKIKDIDGIKGKYDSGAPKYLELRSDWWTANRDQVWKAMTCKAPQQATYVTRNYGGVMIFSSEMCGPSDPPYDDYIPQKLRWLTEWSENYCKQLKSNYDSLQSMCLKCKNGRNNGQCTRTSRECTGCKAMCNLYTEDVKKWKEKWKKQKDQYEKLYNNTNSSTTTDEIQKKHNEFMTKLKADGKDDYKTVGGYVQKEAKFDDCKTQKNFKNDTSDDYAFSNTPKDYKTACSCDKITPCDIVGDILKGKSATDTVEGCNKKEPAGWNCSSSLFQDGEGPCMSARRQKLCINNLKDLTGNNKTPNELKKALIQCAAAETFFAWNKYKTDHPTDAEKKLKDEGTIPEEFKRQMFYTFGDFRDLILDTDISAKTKRPNEKTDVGTAVDNIKNIFTNSAQHNGGKKIEPKNWWKEIEKEVWEGMLCSLSYDTSTKEMKTDVKEKLDQQKNDYNNVTFGGDTTTGVKLPQFSSRPQFLRWMTEWGEDFCRQHKLQLESLETKCQGCHATNGTDGVSAKPTCTTNCEACRTQCQAYQAWLKTWQTHYTSQKGKYTKVKDQSDYKKGDPDVTKYTNAYEYLNEKLKDITCSSKTPSQKCDCMEQKSSPTSDMPKSLDEYPSDDYRKKCTCTTPPPQKPAISKPPCTGNKILDAANEMKHKAQSDAQSRGPDKLKGDISKAKFGKSGSASNLDNSRICDLDKETHTNDFRDYDTNPNAGDDKHRGPCTGKGENKQDRFVIGKKWEPKTGQVDVKYNDVLFPPRRLDMCTSNLENLAKKDGTPDFVDRPGTSVNDSFLGDVLMTAKYEGQDIVHKHLSKGDKSGICNAMKYSFADLGDIIRGRDIWTGEEGNENLQKHLTAIFKKIKDQNGDGKYDSDNEPYTQLRSDWWTANRDQIWKAMTCTAPDTADLYTRNANGQFSFHRVKCGRESYVPPDDYIPQKLRWMTEWSESYCKQLERNYWWLMFNCKACKKAKTKGKEKDAACTFCSSMCSVYKDHVTKWKDDWDKQKEQYSNLYENKDGAADGDEIKKQVNDFFTKVKEKNSCNKDGTDYPNLSDYVTAMGGSTYCNDTTQTKFDVTSGSKDNSVFKEHPKDYKGECEENKTTPTNPPGPDAPGTPKGTDGPSPGLPGAGAPPGRSEPGEPQTPPKSAPTPKEATATTPQQKAACEIVKETLKKKANDGKIENCKPKDYTGTTYPEWDCNEDKFKDKTKGPCMPPRRQKLCLHKLEKLTSSKEDDLRTALIQCAAIETYFSWEKYKKDKQNEKTTKPDELENQLKQGNIPEEFKRIMLFTYGDFKDFILRKDIGNLEGGVQKVRDNIDRIFSKSGKTPSGLSPEDWWETIKKDVWKGMVCALSFDFDNKDFKKDSDGKEIKEKLTENSKYKLDSKKPTEGIAKDLFYIEQTPQFLRWFTEWSEEFCNKQRKELYELHEKCKKCEVKNGSGGKITCDTKGQCKECKSACEAYTTFINKWKDHYDKQNQKYTTDKNGKKYDDVSLVEDNTPAHTFLDQQLEILGLHGNCIKETSTKNKDMPKSLDYPPEEIGDKCTCEDPPKSRPRPAPAPFPANPIGQDSTVARSLPPASNPIGVGSGNRRDPGSTGGVGHSGSSSGPQCQIEKYISDNKSTNIGHGKNYCNPKENSEWKCTASEFIPGHTGACMPPRRQKMCIKYLTLLNTRSSKEKLKEELIKSVSLETYFLWEQYKKDHSSEAEKLKSGEIPEDFKRIMFYTFSDFKDLCLDKDIGKIKSGSDVHKARKNIDNILKPSGKNVGGLSPEQWWSSIQSDVWDAMVCSLTYGVKDDTVRTTLQQTLKNQNGYSDVKFCDKTPLSSFASRPQFLRWMVEWYDDYCQKKHIKLEAVKDKCKPNGGKELKCDKNCDDKCNDYTNFMKGKQTEWGKQSQYYSTKKSENPTPSGYDESDATKYLQKNFTVTCGDTSSGATTQSVTNPVEENINALTTTPPPIYDVDEYCGCKKYIEDKGYVDISGQSNCKGLMKDINDSKDIKWKNKEDTEYKFLSQRNVPQEIYLPPRRQRICFEGLDTKNQDLTDKTKLLTRLMKVAATEGHNLGTYYKKKKEKEDENDEKELQKYSYDVEACRAMKYSFLDLRDIILGYDNVENDSADTETKIKQIIGSGGQNNNEERITWWKDHEKCVWKAMLCGYRKSRDDGHSGNTSKPSEEDLKQCNTIPDDTTYPVADTRDSGMNLQFLRWFAEWGEDFCVKQKKEFATLQTKCQKCDGNKPKCTGCEECTKQCLEYQQFINNWKAQYLKQSSKYTQDKTKADSYKDEPDAKSISDPRVYLHAKIQNITCSTSGNANQKCDCMSEKSSQQPNSGKNIPKSLENPPSGYKEKCDCVNTVDPKQPPRPTPQGPGPGPDAVAPKPGQGPDPNQKDTNVQPSGGSSVQPDGQNPGPDGGDPGNPGGKGGTNTGGQSPGSAKGPDSPIPPGGPRPAVPVSPTDPFKVLDECPHKDPSKCKNYGITRGRGCNPKRNKYDSLENWNTLTIVEKNEKYSVQVPPRRRQLCFPRTRSRKTTDWTPQKFKKHLLDSAATEAKNLMEYYKHDSNLALQAIKYSFGDYGNLIKGDDMENNIDDTKNKINDTISKIKTDSTSASGGPPVASTTTKFDRTDWWETNKKHVWHVMLCQYTGKDKDQHCNDYDDIDKTPQFLRWLEEWARKYCSERTKLANTVKNDCGKDIQKIDFKSTDNNDQKCKIALNSYTAFFNNSYLEWEKLKEKYRKDKEKNGTGGSNSSSYTETDAEEYVKKNCTECQCNYNDLQETYTSITEGNNEVYTLIHRANVDTFNPIEKLFYNILTFGGKGPKIAKTVYDAAGKIGPPIAEAASGIAKDVVKPAATAVATNVISELHNMLKSIKNSSQPVQPPPPVHPAAPGVPPSHPSNPGQTPSSTPSHPVSPSGNPPNVVTSTLPPVGISGVVLGAIALLFYYMKKKTPARTTDIFRVLEIPQNDYGIPDKSSTNRYIPYGQYKGKTYIYVEDHESDKYIMESDTTDVTTSSESEYEEIDINDIYKPRSPKYKTLIEVVLKPSKSGTTSNSGEKPFSGDIPSGIYSDKPSDIPIDDEWNQLKQDFISQYLQNIPKDLPNENIINDDIYKNIEPNILDVNNDEKPFITQIQDRKLNSDDNEIIYNIDWNIPKHTQIYSATYVSPNIYSGIDLINDSLNSGNDIDIYDELLKRKENELYGTKHPKNTTTTNLVAKPLSVDPILNQLDLYDKWLERHRNNQWDDRKRLNHLYEEWNMEHQEHVGGIASNDYTNNINTINEKYNIISTKNLYSHSNIISLEHLGSTNIPPNDLTTQNNGSQTKHLHTNVSMDIHMDEKNNIPCDKDDLENFYNSFDDDENHYMNLKRIVSR